MVNTAHPRRPVSVIKEMRFEATTSYHFTPRRMAEATQTDKTSVGEETKKLQLVHTAGGNVNAAAALESRLKVS